MTLMIDCEECGEVYISLLTVKKIMKDGGYSCAKCGHYYPNIGEEERNGETDVQEG